MGDVENQPVPIVFPDKQVKCGNSPKYGHGWFYVDACGGVKESEILGICITFHTCVFSFIPFASLIIKYEMMNSNDHLEYDICGFPV